MAAQAGATITEASPPHTLFAPRAAAALKRQSLANLKHDMGTQMRGSLVIEEGLQDPAEAPVDLEALRAKFDDDAEFVRRLCQTFVNSTRHTLNALRCAADDGDRARLRSLAHEIKGAAHSLHAHRTATLAATIESAATNMPAAEVSQTVAALSQAFEDVIRHISAELG